MKAVFSYWDGEKKERNTGGCNKFEDMCYVYCLAFLTAKEQLGKISLVTNDFGKKVFVDKLKIPFDEVDLVFNDWKKLNPIFWAFTKMIAYHQQIEPFIHIDNDVFLWSGLKEEIKNKPIFFQSVEPFEEQPQFYGYYKPLLELALKSAPYFPEIIKNNYTRLAYNCGVVGCNELDLIKEWFSISSSYVLNEKNNQSFFKNKENLLIHQNLLQEQYFISSILERKKYTMLNGKVGVLLKDLNKLTGDYKYTHLWGTTKRDRIIIERVKKRVKKDYPETASLIYRLCN